MENVIGQLKSAGFTVTKLGDGIFDVKSESTGAIVKRNATTADLATYLRGIQYVIVKHAGDITEKFKYTNPVFPVV